jgi:hypothetical protein
VPQTEKGYHMDHDLKKPPHTLLIMWDCLGLEYCEDITRRDQHQMWAALKGQAPSLGPYPSLNALVLRARFNSQRHYEIWVVDVDHTITARDMIDMFKENPQEMADLVRQRGRNLYSDRSTTKAVIQ